LDYVNQWEINNREFNLHLKVLELIGIYLQKHLIKISLKFQQKLIYGLWV
jgi:hypothetical protein